MRRKDSMLKNRTKEQGIRGLRAKATWPFVTGTPGAALCVSCSSSIPAKSFDGTFGYRQTGPEFSGILDNRQLQT